MRTAKIPRVRGMSDFFGEESRQLRFLEEVCRKWSHRYGYSDEVITPIIEREELFRGNLGVNSDVVIKEMFQLQDRSGESLALRPEGTMGVLRAVTEKHGCPMPVKLHYSGPMFRYERPQFGRSREFWQFGVECVGSQDEFFDGESISFAHDILKDLFGQLQIPNNYQLLINSLGDYDARVRFAKDLGKYFEANKEFLSKDSQDRLNRGSPLRILDSKDLLDQTLVTSKEVPKLKDYLSDDSESRFRSVLQTLDKLNIPYTLSPNLVRGLEYYAETVFEFVYTRDSSDVSTPPIALIAGGRYQISNIHGVGWAAGISRMISIIPSSFQMPNLRPIFVLSIGKDSDEHYFPSLKVAHHLRTHGFRVTMSSHRSFQKLFDKAINQNAFAVVIVGEDEFHQQKLSLKFLDKNEQISIDWNYDTLTQILTNYQEITK